MDVMDVVLTLNAYPPDKNCITLPDSDCIGENCMHSESAVTEPTSGVAGKVCIAERRDG